MDTILAFLRRRITIVGVTASAFVLSFFLSILAGRDLVVMGLNQPREITDSLKTWNSVANIAVMREMLQERGHPQVVAMSDKDVLETFNDYSLKSPVPHLARLVSAFAALLYLLLFWMLYAGNKIPGDYSILFFALAMCMWAWPTEPAFRQYGGFWLQHAKALGDLRGLLNTIFLLGAWWDLDFKGLSEFDKKRWVKPFAALLLALSAGLMLAFFAGWAHSKDIYADDPDATWYDVFEFLITIPFALVFIRALYYGASKRIQPEQPTRMSRMLGGLYGVLAASGFVFVLLFYLMDNPVYPLNSLKYLVDSRVLVLLYQFLILISVSVLVFSWAFDNLRRTESRDAALLIAQRRQSNHLARGAVLNQILYLQSIQSRRQGQEAAVYGDIIRRLDATLEYQRHIDEYAGSNVQYSNLQRLFTRTMAKFARNEPDIEFDTDNIRFGELREIDTENAGRITQAAFELLNNAVKSIRQAQTEHPAVSIVAGVSGAELFVQITDNGTGNFDSSTYSGPRGFGTEFLNEIVIRHFGGAWHVKSRNDGKNGAVANISIPLNKI